MASTKIADVIVPEVFNPYVRTRTNQLSALWTSGIVERVEELSIFGQRGGTTMVMPFWNDLTGEEEILSDLVPLSVDKITSAVDIAVLNTRGKAWGVNDLSKALSGDDPMAAIGDLVGAYWARRRQVQLLAMLAGIFTHASMAGNVHDISGGVGDLGLVGAETIVDAQYKLGDASSRLTAFAMHSAVVGRLTKLDLIDTEKDSTGAATVKTYQGKRIIEDDSMPVAGNIYTAYMFGQGAIGFADADAPVPTETDRDSLAGEDILINRAHYVLHPRGIKWIGTPTGISPTNAEFATGANWTRVYENKSIRIVQFKFRIA